MAFPKVKMSFESTVRALKGKAGERIIITLALLGVIAALVVAGLLVLLLWRTQPRDCETSGGETACLVVIIGGKDGPEVQWIETCVAVRPKPRLPLKRIVNKVQHFPATIEILRSRVGTEARAGEVRVASTARRLRDDHGASSLIRLLRAVRRASGSSQQLLVSRSVGLSAESQLAQHQPARASRPDLADDRAKVL